MIKPRTRAVFISYPRAVADAVNTLASQIETLGVRVLYDRQLHGGQEWWDEICAFIRECDVFLWVLSPETLNSDACKAERDYAQRLRRSILYVKIAKINDAILPPEILGTNYVNYLTPSAASYQALIDALNHLPDPPPLPDPLPEPPPAPIYSLHAYRLRLQNTALPLSPHEQDTLFIELRRLYQNPDLTHEVETLLHTLRSRPEIMLRTAEVVDTLLTTAPPFTADILSNEIGLIAVHTDCDADWFCGLFNQLEPGQELLWLDTYCPHWNELQIAIGHALERGACARMLVIDPQCESARHRARELEASGWGDYESKFVPECNVFTSVMRGIEKRTGLPGRFRLRIYHDLPSIPMYLIVQDGQPVKGYSSFFLTQATGFNFFHFEWTAPNAYILQHMLRYFELKWERQAEGTERESQTWS